MTYSPALRRSKTSAMTLVEVVTAMGVMTIMMAGVLAAFMQTRRLAAASVAQNCALTIVQGYIEQLKNMPLQRFINAADTQNNPNLTVSFSLPTMKDQTDTSVELQTTPSGVSTATLTGGTAGTTPTGVYDNLETFDMDSQSLAGTTTWATSWPGANTTLVAYPTTVPGKSDLRMNIWVQISDLTPTSSPKAKAYGMLIVYTWQYVDGNRVKYVKDSIRAIRSAVQTF